MPHVFMPDRPDYNLWAQKKGKPQVDAQGWVHESHWQEFLTRDEEPDEQSHIERLIDVVTWNGRSTLEAHLEGDGTFSAFLMSGGGRLLCSVKGLPNAETARMECVVSYLERTIGYRSGTKREKAMSKHFVEKPSIPYDQF